jgi:hypothetical protein
VSASPVRGVAAEADTTDAEKTDTEKNVATKAAMNAKRLGRAFKVRERRNSMADLQLCSGGAARAERSK